MGSCLRTCAGVKRALAVSGSPAKASQANWTDFARRANYLANGSPIFGAAVECPPLRIINQVIKIIPQQHGVLDSWRRTVLNSSKQALQIILLV